MAIFNQPALPLVLKLLSTGEFQDVDSLRALKKLRKKFKGPLTVLLPEDWVHSSKVYLDPARAQHKNLAMLLLREVDQDVPLRLQDIFYDYVELSSSISDLSAYQFYWLKKSQLMPMLKRLKRVGFTLKILTLASEPRLNFLPWRERDQRERTLKQLRQLLLIPFLFFVVFYGVYAVFNYQNQQVSLEIARYYHNNLTNQVGQRQTLAQVNPIFLLNSHLPQGVTLDEADFTNGNWFLSGTLENINALTRFNEVLSVQGWQKLGTSVEVHQQNQQYLWQLKKNGSRP
jgi:Tfp pilus assembly protein PilN